MQRKNFMAAIAKRKAQRAKMPETTAPDHIPDSIDAEFTVDKLTEYVKTNLNEELFEENQKLRAEIHNLKVQFHEAVHEMSGTILRLLKGEKL